MADAVKITDNLSILIASLAGIAPLGDPPIYTTFQIYYPAATLADWNATLVPFGPELAEFTPIGDTLEIYTNTEDSNPLNSYIDSYTYPNLTDLATGAGWHEICYGVVANGATGHLIVDTVGVTYVMPDTITGLTSVRWGLIGDANAGNVVFLGRIQIGTFPGDGSILDYTPLTDGDFSTFLNSVGDPAFSTTGTVTYEDAPVPPPTPTPPTPATVGYRSPFWRFVILDLQTFEILSFLDRLASERTATYTLNQPSVAEGVVPSDNPEINIPWPDPDSDPFLNEGTRVLYGFRREGTLDAPPVWVERFAGIIMQLEDTADSDNAFSHYTAYDPWQYLFSRPVCNSDGSLPGPDGISFTATEAQVIAGELLANTIANQGDVGIDAGLAYGGTGLFTGTVETCEAIDINFPQGTTVGQAWQTLCNMDVCDIILSPLYDPADRPGYLVQWNIYTQAGAPRDDAIFAWDMPSRSLVAIRRLIEGGLQRANEIKYFAGPGGSAAGGELIPVQEDAASVAKYREYWRQTFFPGQNVAGAVEALAEAQLALSKNGRVTVAISPAPERSPVPFEDYWLGDRVPVYASQRFRAPIPSAATSGSDVVTNYQRVYGVPLVIADDATEQINELLTALPGTDG